MRSIALLLFVVSGLSFGATVTYSTYCGPAGASTPTSAASCLYNGGPNSSASATLNAGVTISGNELILSVSISASTTVGTYAQGSLTMTDLVQIDGTGTGYVQYYDAGSRGTQLQLGAAGLSGGAFGHGFGCSQLCFPDNGLLRVMLGVPLSISVNGSFFSGGDTGVGAFSHVDFKFFAADGVTPLNVTEVAPEPSTFVLAALSLGGLAFLGKKAAR